MNAVEEVAQGVRNFFNPLRDLDALFKAVDDTNKAWKSGKWTNHTMSVLDTSQRRNRPGAAARNLILREQKREELAAAEHVEEAPTVSIDAELTKYWPLNVLSHRDASEVPTDRPTFMGMQMPSCLTLGDGTTHGTQNAAAPPRRKTRLVPNKLNLGGLRGLKVQVVEPESAV